jgi:hypothetical protein
MKLLRPLLILSTLCVFPCTLLADDGPDRDERQSNVWVADDDDDSDDDDRWLPCASHTHSGCAKWEDEKSDLQRERERREKNRSYRYYEKHGRPAGS